MRNDLRYALRMLTRRPGWTAVAIATLALAIGANTALFSVIHGVLLQPLPYAESDRLVRIYGSDPTLQEIGNLSPQDFLDWHRDARSFEDLGAYSAARRTLVVGGEPLQLSGLRVTPGYFDVLKAPAAIGRTFSREEGAPGAEPMVVLSDRLWRSSFGADLQVAGASLAFEEGRATVVGVMPAGFSDSLYESGFPEFWINLAIDPERHGRGGHWLQSIGRLRPGVSLGSAQAEMNIIMERLEAEHPWTNANERARLIPLLESVVGPARPALWMMLAAVGFLLLIACANVANLMLARTVSRRSELAVRAALGAGRGRLARQLMTESLLLGGLGGLAGLGLAAWGIDLLVASQPPGLPRLDAIGMNLWVLLFSVGVSVLTGLLFGLLPALRSSATDLQQSLKEDSRTGQGRGQHRIRSALVVAEVAIAVVLVAGAGFLVRSFSRVLDVDPGFRPAGVLTIHLSLPSNRYAEPALRVGFFEQLQESLAADPRLIHAGSVNARPLSNRWSCDSFHVADRPLPDVGEIPCAESRVVSGDYFRAMGISLRGGRLFRRQDHADSELVVLINEEMAQRYWPGGDAVGQRFKWLSREDETPWRRVIGVVGSVRHFGLERDVALEVYQPHAQRSSTSRMTLVVRTEGDPQALIGLVRERVREFDARLPLTAVATLDEVLVASVAARRFGTTLFSAFAVVAFLLAAVGVFGVLSWAVTERLREIGLRIALGAQRSDIYRLITRQSILLIGVGLAAGLIGSVGLGRLASQLLFEVPPTDPITLGGTALLLLATGLVASLVPAMRAMRVDPSKVLRQE